ncbi:MAGUK p55 subfamily member 4-like [Oncorhynchus masou masou]|uniref:MAGUK p55 subfamily member 4-like n=1 Tax=Oncorhynchus masou masou TaxID=90313 RepID=UPI003183AECC
MGSVPLLVLAQNMCDDMTETSQVCSSLSGPSGIGVNELRRRLLKINPVTFQGAVPHTTRAAKSHEESDKEYHFINRELFENMVYNNKPSSQ